MFIRASEDKWKGLKEEARLDPSERWKKFLDGKIVIKPPWPDTWRIPAESVPAHARTEVSSPYGIVKLVNYGLMLQYMLDDVFLQYARWIIINECSGEIIEDSDGTVRYPDTNLIAAVAVQRLFDVSWSSRSFPSVPIEVWKEIADYIIYDPLTQFGEIKDAHTIAVRCMGLKSKSRLEWADGKPFQVVNSDKPFTPQAFINHDMAKLNAALAEMPPQYVALKQFFAESPNYGLYDVRMNVLFNLFNVIGFYRSDPVASSIEQLPLDAEREVAQGELYLKHYNTVLDIAMQTKVPSPSQLLTHELSTLTSNSGGGETLKVYFVRDGTVKYVTDKRVKNGIPFTTNAKNVKILFDYKTLTDPDMSVGKTREKALPLGKRNVRGPKAPRGVIVVPTVANAFLDLFMRLFGKVMACTGQNGHVPYGSPDTMFPIFASMNGNIIHDHLWELVYSGSGRHGPFLGLDMSGFDKSHGPAVIAAEAQAMLEYLLKQGASGLEWHGVRYDDMMNYVMNITQQAYIKVKGGLDPVVVGPITMRPTGSAGTTVFNCLSNYSINMYAASGSKDFSISNVKFVGDDFAAVLVNQTTSEVTPEMVEDYVSTHIARCVETGFSADPKKTWTTYMGRTEFLKVGAAWGVLFEGAVSTFSREKGGAVDPIGRMRAMITYLQLLVSRGADSAFLYQWCEAMWAVISDVTASKWVGGERKLEKITIPWALLYTPISGCGLCANNFSLYGASILCYYELLDTTTGSDYIDTVDMATTMWLSMRKTPDFTPFAETFKRGGFSATEGFLNSHLDPKIIQDSRETIANMPERQQKKILPHSYSASGERFIKRADGIIGLKQTQPDYKPISILKHKKHSYINYPWLTKIPTFEEFNIIQEKIVPTRVSRDSDLYNLLKWFGVSSVGLTEPMTGSSLYKLMKAGEFPPLALDMEQALETLYSNFGSSAETILQGLVAMGMGPISGMYAASIFSEKERFLRDLELKKLGIVGAGLLYLDREYLFSMVQPEVEIETATGQVRPSSYQVIIGAAWILAYTALNGKPAFATW